MSDTPSSSPGLFAERLEHLFQTVTPPGKKRYSSQDVADAIGATTEGPSIAASYIHSLRKGAKDNPTYKHIIALAKFFGVHPSYFFEEPDAAAADEARDRAIRTDGLSEEALNAIRTMVESARTLQGLPPS
ncbi:helix-turn-helix domain-containing protein [Actinocorallia sp. API 0066]|uniref:helix-turn-helix domain-containing protein n=1 Tax=Actinocorallia sp. API 0066 TaxID=2896846 RepID=UPI001E59429B|nr:helix-turn-helix transcriptional regulator [Actinocorallia sp. API 0066]MCD0449451.1 helix-turn-helix domain-containing protein [Actinocorallia sp. API 0066]